jgi:hypothetical protein
LNLAYQMEIPPELRTLANHLVNHLYELPGLLPGFNVFKTDDFHWATRVIGLLGLLGYLSYLSYWVAWVIGLTRQTQVTQ